MMKETTDILFSPAIRATHSKLGARDYISRLESREYWKAGLSSEQMDFIRGRDSMYFGTASKEGCPYVQHRGGPVGFIRVQSATALWFPDYSGNRLYISVGNLSENNRAFIFMMDYANRRRLKLWGRAYVLDRKYVGTDPDKRHFNRGLSRNVPSPRPDAAPGYSA